MTDQSISIALLVVAFAVFSTAVLLCSILALAYSDKKPFQFYITVLFTLIFSILSLLVLSGLMTRGVKVSLGLSIIGIMLLAHLVIVVSVVRRMSRTLYVTKR